MTAGHVGRRTKCDDPSLISLTKPHVRSHAAPKAQKTKCLLIRILTCSNANDLLLTESESCFSTEEESVEFPRSSFGFCQTLRCGHSKTAAPFWISGPTSTGRSVLWETILQNDSADAALRVCFKARPLMLLQQKLILKSRSVLNCYACAINADQQPARLSVARVCVLTLGILKKLCIIQSVHRFIDSS